ncbi:MAG: hypothetical protein ACYTBJ_19365 [Planctomycetota bacterium]|jgi:hypothetical protein
MPLIVKKKEGDAGLEIPREVRGQGPEAVSAYVANKAEEGKAAKKKEKGADK